MTSSYLTASGRERQIFLRSLRDYSESCDLPDLTPGCPYRKIDSDGQPYCLEECVDLLAVHKAPGPVEERQVGEFRLHRTVRPRPRRVIGNSKPFDAQEMLLSDEDSPTSVWRTTSLLLFMRQQLSTPPSVSAGREAERLNDVIAELESRGFDVLTMVRAGFSASIAMSIALIMAMPHVGMPEADELAEFFNGLEYLNEGWRTALFDELPAAGEDYVIGVFKALGSLESWVRTAALADIIDWNPPTRQALRRAPSDTETSDTARWLIDRFTGTYLRSWATESLLLEFRYIHGHEVAPCGAAEMRDRMLDAQEVATAIAEKTALGFDEALTSLSHLVGLALKLLAAGNPEAAAGVFRGVLAVQPRNAEARNNLGFCLLAEDPEAALTELERASRAGYEAPWNVGNRILALILLGRLTTALELAEAYLGDVSKVPAGGSHLWRLTPDGIGDVNHVSDCRLYIIDLAIEAATRANADDQIERWKCRREKLA